jgi:hypothetical protein
MRLIIISLLLITSTLLSQDGPFNIGEKLNYSLQFNFIKMGRGYLLVDEDEAVNDTPAHHVTFYAKTSKFADRIFKVRDKVDIWLDQQDLTTLKVLKQIQEGDYKKNFYTVIDYENSIAITNNDTIPLDGRVRDPYSLLFYLRTIPLEVGQILDFTTFDRKKTTDFQVMVAGKETIKTPAGTFTCKIIKPFREGKSLLKNSGDMMIWFSDDAQCIPVQIQIKLKFGSMLLQLLSIS